MEDLGADEIEASRCRNRRMEGYNDIAQTITSRRLRASTVEHSSLSLNMNQG